MDSTVRASDKGSSWEGDATTSAPVREGEVVSEKYACEKVIGVGGMGVVVTARDLMLERKVAIKFLLPRFISSEVAVQRFIREARAATRITSEHVVKLLEIDRLPNGMPFLVMEYLEGRDLKAVLTDSGPLPPRLAVDYVLQAAQAVAEGHLKGIIHRDIKPSNLFIARRADGTPLIKVLDFGIAKTFEEEAFDAGLTGSDDTRLGTPAYMPPEQLQSPRAVDARSDVWGLGVTLYELLTDALPFSGDSFADLVLQITRAAPEPLSRHLERGVPPGLEEVIFRCLEKDRERRYPDVLEFAAALAPFGSEDAAISLRRVRGLKYSVSPATQEGPESVLEPTTPTLRAEEGLPPPVPERKARPRSGYLAAAVLSGLGVAAWLISSSRTEPTIGPPTEIAVTSSAEPPSLGSVAANLEEEAKVVDDRVLVDGPDSKLEPPALTVPAAASARPQRATGARAPLLTSVRRSSAPPPSASTEPKAPPPRVRSIEALIETRR
jgi:serine/threonine protein kinase